MSKAPWLAGRREPSMMDVARAAGVSIASVSRALHGAPGVSEATRSRIQRTAQELGYTISRDGPGPLGGRTGRVAVVIPRLEDGFHGMMLAGIAPVLRMADLELLLYQLEGPKQRSRFLRDLESPTAEALIIAAMQLAPAELGLWRDLNLHVVVVGGALHGYPHVHVADADVARLAVQHLINLGHQRIGMIRTTSRDPTAAGSEHRIVRAWRETLSAAGLRASEELLVTVRSPREGGAQGIGRLMGCPDAPTAVVASSGEAAVAALLGAQSVGRRIPDDLSVIGLDSQPSGCLAGVTTVDRDAVGQGKAAAELAVRLIGGGRVASLDLPARVVDRGSTAAPRVCPSR